VRPGTPISNADPNEFPSPRVGLEENNNNNSRNFDLVPHFNEDKNGNKIDYDTYIPEGCKNILKYEKHK
jgi:hypothetical protein